MRPLRGSEAIAKSARRHRRCKPPGRRRRRKPPGRRRRRKPPGRRRALEMLAARGPAGLAAIALIERGYTVPDLLELVHDGLATGRREFDLSRLWITEQGRAALEKATGDG